MLPTSALADNAPWTLPMEIYNSYLGKIVGIVAALEGTGTGAVILTLENVNQQFTYHRVALFMHILLLIMHSPQQQSWLPRCISG